MFRLPRRLKDIIPPAAATKVLDLLSQPTIGGAIREATSALGLKDVQAAQQLQDAWQQARHWFDSFSQQFRSSLSDSLPVIDGTGIVFRADGGGLPLSGNAIEAAIDVGTRNVSLQTLHDNARQMLIQKTGAEDALVVCSLEMAISLAGQATESKDGVILPRSEGIRLSSHSDLRKLLSGMGTSVIDAGAVNLSTEQDLEQEVRSSHQNIVTISPNPLLSKETTDKLRNAAIEVSKRRGCLLTEILLNGTFVELDSLSLDTVAVSSRVAAGIDLCILPGDRYVGGPSCGILVGKKVVIERLTRRAQELGAIAPAIFQATLIATLASQQTFLDWQQLPVGLVLTNGLENLRNRARRLQMQLENTPDIASVEIRESKQPIGDGPFAQQTLESVELVLGLKVPAASFVEKRFSQTNRLDAHCQGNQLTLNLRTIDPNHDSEIVDGFVLPAKETESASSPAPSQTEIPLEEDNAE